MVFVWLKFIACLLIVVIAGQRVAKYGDILADKTGLGGAWIGVVLVAIATSLPELFTGISSVALVKAPDLTIGDLFGANSFNLLNLALLDIIHRHGPLLTASSVGHLLTAGFSLILVAVAAAGILVSGMGLEMTIGWIGIYTPVIILLYLAIVKIIFNFERRQHTESRETEGAQSHEYISLKKAYLYYAIAGLFIIGAGTWLAFVGEEIARATGWGECFVGCLFIGFTTTLPEITVSFSALRLGAVDLCVANMIGSNLFNMTIVGIDDLLYTSGPVLKVVSLSHVFTGLVVILMTGIFVAGLVSRPERKTPLGASWYAIALIGVFLLGTYINFHIR